MSNTNGTANGIAKTNSLVGKVQVVTIAPAPDPKPAIKIAPLEEPAKPETPTAKPAETPAPTAPAPDPIEKRIQRFQNLERLKERRDQVTEAIEDLKAFHFSQAGGGSVKLTDSNNTTRVITHPIVVAEMVANALAKMEAELSAVDAQFIV